MLRGSVKEVAQADSSLSNPQRRATDRYDSVMVRRTASDRETQCLFDEYAVYEPDRVLPRHVIFFKRMPLPTIVRGIPERVPVEIVKREDGDVTLYEISSQEAQRDIESSAAYHFFRAQSLVVQLSNYIAAFAGLKLMSVTYCHNPKLSASFDNARKTLRFRSFPADILPKFHGTAEANLRKIQLDGFRIGGLDGYSHATDSGWWGKGIYLGMTPEVSLGYARGANSMLLVLKLAGVNYPRHSGRRNNGDGLKIDECAMDDRPVLRGQYQSYDAQNGEFCFYPSTHAALLHSSLENFEVICFSAN